MVILGWFLMILASVLAADAVMALLFSRRYLRWGAGFLPEDYRAVFERFIELPLRTLVLLALAELALAVALHWLGWNLAQ